jgi:hypothetical protein
MVTHGMLRFQHLMGMPRLCWYQQTMENRFQLKDREACKVKYMDLLDRNPKFR